MTKRPLYAAAQRAAAVVAVLTVFPASAHTRPAPQGNTCAACLSIAVDPGAAMSLPLQLDGLEVFVRVMAGQENASLPALLEIERRGGRPSLLVSSVPSPLSADLSAHVRGVIVSEPIQPVGQPDAEFVFSLKTRLTSLRAGLALT